MREVVPLTEHESHLREPTLSREDFQGNSEKSQPIDEMRMAEKPVTIFGRSKGTTFIVITMNLEFKLYAEGRKFQTST